jgi:hypothetical protein
VKITLENTTHLVTLEMGDGKRVPARIWEGHTESGIPVHAYITRIAAAEDADLAQFERELQETRKPSAEIEAIPMRLIL